MLDMALEYQEAVTVMTERQQNGLRELELSDDEWEILQKLRDVLKVTVTVTRIPSMLHLTTTRFSKMPRYFSLGIHPTSRL